MRVGRDDIRPLVITPAEYAHRRQGAYREALSVGQQSIEASWKYAITQWQDAIYLGLTSFYIRNLDQLGSHRLREFVGKPVHVQCNRLRRLQHQ